MPDRWYSDVDQLSGTNARECRDANCGGDATSIIATGAERYSPARVLPLCQECAERMLRDGAREYPIRAFTHGRTVDDDLSQSPGRISYELFDPRNDTAAWIRAENDGDAESAVSLANHL